MEEGHWIFKKLKKCQEGFYFINKLGPSLLLLATLTSLISKASAFPPVGHKVIAAHHQSVIIFPCSCVSWQLWITGVVKMPGEPGRKAHQSETAGGCRWLPQGFCTGAEAPPPCLAAVGRDPLDMKGYHLERQLIYVRGLNRTPYQVQVLRDQPRASRALEKGSLCCNSGPQGDQHCSLKYLWYRGKKKKKTRVI